MEDPYKLFLGKVGSFTEIQRLAIAPVEGGKDCLIIAPTGSGKTEAAMLPVLARLLKGGRGKGIMVLYITPLRALNRDLVKRLVSMCAEVGLTAGVRHGDTMASERRKQLAAPPNVLITTPESLQNLLLSKALKSALKALDTVIVDEVHELYYNKRGAQLSIALERISELAGGFKRIGISATVGDPHAVERFMFNGRPHEVVRASTRKQYNLLVEFPEKPVAEHADFRKTYSLDDQSLARIERVAALIGSANATIVFVNTRSVAESLGSKLISLNKAEHFGEVGIHHSSIDKEERIRVENAFKDGKLKVIVATSSLELGIDIGRVDRVVQYGSPKQAIRLVQRMGRGGHREKVSVSGNIIVASTIDAIEAAVISKFASEGTLEKPAIEYGALDVLVNQICAMAVEHRSISAERIFDIVRKAAPYAGLERSTFDRLLLFAADARLVSIREGMVGMGGRGLEYFISNISVIPDNARFLVKNIITNKVVSTLDEKFVYNYIDSGSSFITRGIPWKVVSIDEEAIFVEPSRDVEAAIPDWDGEDIPVSRQVAREVFLRLAGADDIGRFLDDAARGKVAAFISKQHGFFAPDAGKLFVEDLDDYTLIYAPLGKLANEFLAKIVGAVLYSEVGGGISIRATPYAIIVSYENTARRADMRRVLAAVANFDFYKKNDLIMGSELFRYKFVQVAKLFGIVEKKATITKSGATKLISFYRDSPVAEEAMRELGKNYFDMEAVSSFIGGIKRGEIQIEEFRSNGSPISEEILRAAYHYKELLMPSAPDETDVANFKRKFGEKEIRLLCTFCGFSFVQEVGVEGDSSFACRRCKSPMLAMYSDEYNDVLAKRLSGGRLTRKESTLYYEMVGEAGLISAYGNRAVIALATYGIGRSTAARLLKYMRKDYKEFYFDLIEAQKNFVRTKKFWKA